MYVNRATKEIIIVLAGCKGYADVLQQCSYNNHEKALPYITAMGENANKALEIIMDGLDQDQVKGITRFADNMQLMAMPKFNPRSQYDCYVVPADVFDRLFADVVTDCAFCVKEGKEVERCQRRRDLAACGVVMGSNGSCPYQQ